jgi:DNA-binding NtrC family response regulator
MKRRKSALVVSESPIVKQEMRRMLNELHVNRVFEARDIEAAVEIAQAEIPVFTFIDADANLELVEELATFLKSEINTKIIFLKRKDTFSQKNMGQLSVLEKPVTLNRLNDVIHPSLSFAALIAEAQSLIEQEPATIEFQL